MQRPHGWEYDVSTPADHGFVVIDGEVTFVQVQDERGRLMQIGEFPHCRMTRKGDRVQQCKATINITDHTSTGSEQCTREKGHGMPHVAHAAPGLPVIAWRPQPSEPVQDGVRDA